MTDKDTDGIQMYVYGAINSLNEIHLLHTAKADIYATLRLDSEKHISFGTSSKPKYRSATVDGKIFGIYEQDLESIGDFRLGSCLNFIFPLPSDADPKMQFEQHYQKELSKCFPGKTWEETVTAFALAVVKYQGDHNKEQTAIVQNWTAENLREVLIGTNVPKRKTQLKVKSNRKSLEELVGEPLTKKQTRYLHRALSPNYFK